MKIRAKLIAAVCGALLLEGVVSFLAVYLGLSKFITPGALIAYSIVVILSIIAGAAIATVFSFRFVKTDGSCQRTVDGDGRSRSDLSDSGKDIEGKR